MPSFEKTLRAALLDAADLDRDTLDEVMRRFNLTF
jgi:hypothetical protein